MEKAKSLRFMPADEYLIWEPTQAEKYEFIHGELFLMGGASRRHVTVAGNFFPAEHSLNFSSLDITISWGRIFRNVD